MAKKKIEDKQECILTVLSESKSNAVIKLREIYEQDRQKAKVIFDNNKNNYGYSDSKLCLFEYPNGDFRLVSLSRKYGMSVNAVLYGRESNNWVISYKHKTKGFYFIEKNKNIRALTMHILNAYCATKDNIVYDFMLKRFGWMRNLSESTHGGALTFATIIRHKLYNEREIMKHVFKCPYPLAKMLDEHRGSYSPWDCAKVWKEQRKVLLNIENLKPEIYTSPYFLDTTKMASSLGKKVNCSWGLKRLKQEHDNFSKEIVKVILEFEELQQLRIKKVYRDFAAFSGFELLETNHDLIAEGKTMHHCVGTYSSTVDTGTCAIYRYKGHTLDLRFRKPYVFKSTDEELKKKLDINQFMGYDNVSAPKELRDEVQLILDAFNSNLIDYDTEDDIEWYESLNHDNDLPF